MKVLLANIPWEKNGKSGVRAGSRWPHIKDEPEDKYLPFPFFLAYATSLLKENGFDAVLVDAIAEGISYKEFIQKAHKESPDLMVVETSTVSLNDDLNFINSAKFDMPIALCGPHSGISEPDFLIEQARIRYILKGEYEFTLLDLVKQLSNGSDLSLVYGLTYRSGNGKNVKVNPARVLIENLDELPWPWRKDLPMLRYHDTPGDIPWPSVQMLASRGCPFGCKFCLWPQVMYGERNYRVRSLLDVVDEMEFLVREMGFKSIYFDDDTFNISREQMFAFSRLIKERNRQKRINVPWAIMARADLMDRQLLEEMHSAGLAAIKYGIESAEQSIVTNCGKDLDLKKTEMIVGITKELGIKTHLSFAFGLPGETKETVRKTIFYTLHLDPASVQFSIATPFPGTEYYNDSEKSGFLVSKEWSDYDGNYKSVVRTERLNARELKEARDKAYLIWGQHCRFRGGHSLRKLWRKLLNYGDLLGFPEAVLRAVKFLWKKRGLILRNLILTASLKLGKIFKNLTVKQSHDYLAKVHGNGRHRKREHSLLKRYVTSRLALIGIMDGRHAYVGPHLAQIDLTNDCNNNCIGCWCNSPLLRERRMPEYEKSKFLPLDMVRRLLDELHEMGTREIYLAGGGEPFQYPWIMDVLRYIKSKGFTCYVNTNFTLLNEDNIREIIDIGIDHFTVSLWAGNSDIYARTHPNKDASMFLHIREMLKLVSFLKKEKGKVAPYIKIYNVISGLNYDNFDEMIDFVAESDAESVEFTVIDTIPGYTDCLLLSDEQRRFLTNKCDSLRRRSREFPGNHMSLLIRHKGRDIVLFRFEQFARRLFNLSAACGEYDKGVVDNTPCYVGWVFTRVLADGNVNACLKAHRLPIGNLYRQSFSEIWNSRRQEEFRLRTRVENKDDPIFKMIGNDPALKTGCYKSCDDLGRNQHMSHKLQGLWFPERLMLTAAALGFKACRIISRPFPRRA